MDAVCAVITFRYSGEMKTGGGLCVCCLLASKLCVREPREFFPEEILLRQLYAETEVADQFCFLAESPGRPVLALTLKRQAPGWVDKWWPAMNHWYDSTQENREAIPEASAVETGSLPLLYLEACAGHPARERRQNQKWRVTKKHRLRPMVIIVTLRHEMSRNVPSLLFQ